jgi:hypothetical protein
MLLKKKPTETLQDDTAQPDLIVLDYIMLSSEVAGNKDRIPATRAAGDVEKPINADTLISQHQEYLSPSKSGERGWLK